jgi:hypothetical protein
MKCMVKNASSCWSGSDITKFASYKFLMVTRRRTLHLNFIDTKRLDLSSSSMVTNLTVCVDGQT